MEIELHITTNKLSNQEIPAFEKFCHSIHAKPIVILLSEGEFQQQPMISKIINCNDESELKKEINTFKELFSEAEYRITRIKMEVAPWDKIEVDKMMKQENGCYFEWHGKIKVEDEENINSIVENQGGRISRNVLKKDTHHKFITLRNSPEEREDYEDSLKYYRDLKNVVDTSKQEGIKEVELNLLEMGMSLEDISKATGLSVDEISGL